MKPAMTAQDVAGVIAELRKADELYKTGDVPYYAIEELDSLLERSADLIESQAKALSAAEASNTALWTINGQSSGQIKTLVGQKTEWMDRALAAESRLAEAMRVIEPFSNLADTYFSKYEVRPGEFRETYSSKPDGEPIWAFNGTPITHGHLRAARDFLNAKEKT